MCLLRGIHGIPKAIIDLAYKTHGPLLSVMVALLTGIGALGQARQRVLPSKIVAISVGGERLGDRHPSMGVGP